VVELDGDCFGDAVNVAARLLDHASDGEVLITQRVFDALPAADRAGLRPLHQVTLRGRVEPVFVHVMGGRRTQDSSATAFAEAPSLLDPDAIRLHHALLDQVLQPAQMPAVLGRSPQAAFQVDDVRVSRQHARLDWHGGSFQLTDLSSNGTYVRFADGEMVSLRRGSCTLHGKGRIGLGGSPLEPGSAIVRFDVIRLGGAQP
jgi:adenylate cyclase